MKPTYNVMIMSDHLVVMQKLPVVWGKLSIAERLALHEVVEAKLREVAAAIPDVARTGDGRE